jgi:hypothetical protein
MVKIQVFFQTGFVLAKASYEGWVLFCSLELSVFDFENSLYNIPWVSLRKQVYKLVLASNVKINIFPKRFSRHRPT